MRKTISVACIFSVFLMSIIIAPTIFADSSDQGSKPPTIADMAEYDKFDHPVEPPSPLPESELVEITFPKTWLLKHDEVESFNIVKVTFPVTWLVNQPEVSKDDTPVRLRIPKKMLELEDLSVDPNFVTVALTL